MIAKEIGFQDAQEEQRHLAATGGEWNGKEQRSQFVDEEILDYAFLTDTLVLRLREVAYPRTELEFWVEVFEILPATQEASFTTVCLSSNFSSHMISPTRDSPTRL